MQLNEALETISNSLIQDSRVKAIFVKGSVGRGEHDEHSDLDLYCLVEDCELEGFLKDRIRHLESYNQLLFHDDIYIIAPQILAVYENMVHVDLFTVTPDTFVEKDYYKVIHDPQQRLIQYEPKQSLRLSAGEFQDAVDDVAWFLFQYRKASARSNDLWAVNLLNNVITNLSRVLLHRYRPERAQLGLKTLKTSLPEAILAEVKKIQEHTTPGKHQAAVVLLIELLKGQTEWIFKEVPDSDKIKPLWNRMIG
ncbi:nucleotidyltransferase domain-containing protein [Mesobacillus subterraneus]|uniref:Nucleotidyltransferase domain-containing protein n=1 Tax=Mesobacillus subterraneus TaxID=285983 RepID=A0A427TWI0_9BACI|nr:nucleotidyltransferase domain-containing protein [Mesobacillus subterraneus]RSD28710.1 nucleotidyltransferase domain-containing protein [Mesobacillus subterraneus]